MQNVTKTKIANLHHQFLAQIMFYIQHKKIFLKKH